MSNEDERYIKSLIATVQDLATQLGTIREQVKEDTSGLLRGYREDVHRTTMAIHARLLSYEDELIRDRTAREKRQTEIDQQLGRIHTRIDSIRNNQKWRVRIEIALVVIGIIALAWWL